MIPDSEIERRRKISIAHKGRRFSKSHRENLSIAFRKSWTPERRMKFSLLKNGKSIPHLIGGYWKGKHFSKETRRKLSDARKGRPLPEWRKIQNSKLQMGEKNHNWQGGITALQKQIRRCFLYRQWRSDVFTRDDFTCQW